MTDGALHWLLFPVLQPDRSCQAARAAAGTAGAELWQDAGLGAAGREGSWRQDGTSCISSLHPFSKASVERL